MKNQSDRIQSIVIDWFKNYDNETISQFIKHFSYFEVNPKPEMSILIEKFLIDNGIEIIYPKYVQHLKTINDPNKPYFRNITSSEIEIINEIHHALLNLVFNRFSTLVLVEKIYNIQKREINAKDKVDEVNNRIIKEQENYINALKELTKNQEEEIYNLKNYIENVIS